MSLNHPAFYRGDRPEFRKDLSGQRLYFRAAEGRPSATPSVGIVDSGGATIQASADTYVTQDTVNTTLDDAATIGAYTIPLTSTTGIKVGNTYLITNADGQSEWPRVRSIDSGVSVTVADKLSYAYASGDAFQSCDFYYTLQSGDVDALGEFFVATATYSVTGVANVQPITQTFDVVLHPLKNPLTAEAIRRRWPDLAQTQTEEQDGELFALQCEYAWDCIKAELRSLGRRPALITSSENLFPWAMDKLACILFDIGVPVLRGVSPEIAVTELDRRCETSKKAAVGNLEYYDKLEDQARGVGDSSVRRMDMVR